MNTHLKSVLIILIMTFGNLALFANPFIETANSEDKNYSNLSNEGNLSNQSNLLEFVSAFVDCGPCCNETIVFELVGGDGDYTVVSQDGQAVNNGMDLWSLSFSGNDLTLIATDGTGEMAETTFFAVPFCCEVAPACELYEVSYSCSDGIQLEGTGECNDVILLMDQDGNTYQSGSTLIDGIYVLLTESGIVSPPCQEFEITVSCGGSTCNSDNPLEMPWLDELVTTYGDDCFLNSVLQFQFEGSSYFATIPGDCLDVPTNFYNCEGELICWLGGLLAPPTPCSTELLTAYLSTATNIWTYDNSNEPCEANAGTIISDPEICGLGAVFLQSNAGIPLDYEYVYLEVSNFDDSFIVLSDNFAYGINGCYYGMVYNPDDSPNFDAASFTDFLDSGGCFDLTDCFETNYISPPEFQISTNPSCFGDGLFQVGITVSGGSGFYTLGEDYLGNEIFASEWSETFIVFQAGEPFYDIYPIDANTGCGNDYSISVNAPDCGEACDYTQVGTLVSVSNTCYEGIAIQGPLGTLWATGSDFEGFEEGDAIKFQPAATLPPVCTDGNIQVNFNEILCAELADCYEETMASYFYLIDIACIEENTVCGCDGETYFCDLYAYSNGITSVTPGPCNTNTNTCELPPDPGGCFAYIPRYYYDAAEGDCLEFIYGGCGGNANNFETYQVCIEACGEAETPICELPPDSGPCEAAIPRYYYDSDEGDCLLFTYGGCDGNANNFEEYEVCIEACGEIDPILPAIFEPYPWLTDMVNPNDCNPNELVGVYDFGGYSFVFVQNEEGTTMYFDDGSLYCVNADNFNCAEAYGLGSPDETWTCGGLDCICLDIYAPVCGVDGSTYGNECEATCAGVAIAQSGECETNPEIFADYNWLSNLVNPDDCNQGDNISIFQSGIYDFVFVETNEGANLYFQNGDFYCSDTENFSCVAAYGLVEEVATWTCGDITINPTPEIFEDFSWLSGVVDSEDCNGETIEVYNQGIYSFIQIQSTNGNTLYFQDGTFYCADSPGFSCVAAYGLSSPTTTWTCGNGPTEPIVEYPWLLDFLPEDCENSDVNFYAYSAENYVFIYILNASSNMGELYFQDGTFYCEDAPNYSCLEAYGFSFEEGEWLDYCGGIDKTGPLQETELTELGSIKIYPNPTQGKLFLSVDVPQFVEQTISLYDLTGKQIHQIQVDANRTNAPLELDLYDLPKGMYLLEWRTFSQSEVRRLVID